ncbi:MAG: 30S ribosomal protein S7 [Alphaproteobacteria bacterium]
MSRRRAAEKRPVVLDARYGDSVLGKFINCLMYGGKKSVAERIVYGALQRIEQKGGQDARQIFHAAVDNVKPAVEVRSRRVGGATYPVPVEVRASRSQALATRWLIKGARDRVKDGSEKTMGESLAAELLGASQNRGAAIKRREEAHRMAEANKAFSHYRW